MFATPEGKENDVEQGLALMFTCPGQSESRGQTQLPGGRKVIPEGGMHDA